MSYPNVPDLPGVPALLRDPAQAARSYVEQNIFDFTTRARGVVQSLNGIVTGNVADLLGTGDDLASSSTQYATWGVFFPDGTQALFPDSFLGIEYRNSSKISEYPLEQGAFETYNKIANPFDVVIGLTKGGDIIARTNFLADVALMADGLALFTLVTPEQVFTSVNCERYDYKRTVRDGATLLTVNLYFKEVRVKTQSEFTSQSEEAPSVEDAAQGTTAATVDSSADVAPLTEENIRNPASASLQSQGQAQAIPASPEQAAPAMDAPTSLPTGFTQDALTGAVRNLRGQIDSRLTIVLGSNFLG